MEHHIMCKHVHPWLKLKSWQKAVTSQTAVRVRLQDNVMTYACLELQQLSQRRYTK